MNIDKLRKAMQDADASYSNAKRVVDNNKRRRLWEASEWIEADMKEDYDAVRVLSSHSYNARMAYETAYAEAQASAFFTLDDGTTLKAGDVVSMVRASSWRRERKRLTGVVEVVNHSTSFPANLKHGRPQIGSFIVRLRTADGKIGVRFDILHANSQWRPVK